MIQPSLFVGIGTTGLRIVQFLRRFVFEEFGVPGLPFFRYLVIESEKPLAVGRNMLRG